MQTFRSISWITAFLFLPSAAFAVDGVVLINQASALAGSVTPGDTPGFPVTISQPGSYRLSSNLLLGYPGAIDIESDNVTIDLNGFTIFGGAICDFVLGVFECEGAGGSAIFTTTTVGFSNITIRNGFIQNTLGAGIYCPVCNDVLLDHLVIDSTNQAINVVNGSNVVIRDCLVTNSGGVYLSNGVTEGVVLAQNAIGMGGTNLTVRDSVFFGNGAASFASGQIVGFSGVSFIAEPAPLSGFSLGQNTLGGSIWQ